VNDFMLMAMSLDDEHTGGEMDDEEASALEEIDRLIRRENKNGC
jgi:hypothetical protein